MQFVIVSGLSGAGKSKAASDLEDFGFYCVDNMPAEMIPLADLQTDIPPETSAPRDHNLQITGRADIHLLSVPLTFET